MSLGLVAAILLPLIIEAPEPMRIEDTNGVWVISPPGLALSVELVTSGASAVSVSDTLAASLDALGAATGAKVTVLNGLESCRDSVSCRVQRGRDKALIIIVYVTPFGDETRYGYDVIDPTTTSTAAQTVGSGLLRVEGRAGAGQVARALVDAVEPALRDRGLWGQFGTVTIDGLPRDATVSIAGLGAVNVVDARIVSIEGLRPGAVEITVSAEEWMIAPARAVVLGGAHGVLIVDPQPAGDRIVRRGLFWGSVGAVVLGAAAMAITGILSSSRTPGYCVTSDPVCPSTPAGVVAGGFSLLPVGLGAMGLGLGGVGEAVFRGEREASVLGVAVGVAAGIAAVLITSVATP